LDSKRETGIEEGSKIKERKEWKGAVERRRKKGGTKGE
jgi:hypothetical protein